MSLATKQLIDYFPFPSIRDNQRTVINRIEKAIIEGKKFIILEAPTGFGKSPVAATVAKFSGQSHLLTATKDLQTQYSKDFPFMKVVKGRNNFKCIDVEETVKQRFNMEIEDETTCDNGMCVVDSNYKCQFKTKAAHYTVETADKDHPENEKVVLNMEGLQFLGDRDPCIYYNQKWITFKSSHSIYNYKYFLSCITQAKKNPEATGNIQKKRLLILDEAHLLEEEMKDFNSVSINVFKLKGMIKIHKFNIRGDELNLDSWLDELSSIKERLMTYISENTANADSHSKELNRKLVAASRYVDKIDNLLFEIQEVESSNWIVGKVERHNGDIVKVVFLPLSVSRYTRELFRYGDTVLMMSATILSKNNFCDMTGLAYDEVEYITVGSEFPVTNRPIYCLNIGRMSNATMPNMLPLISKKVDDILSRYKTVKGIVHTTSYKQLEYILNNISQDNKRRLLRTGEGIDREQLVTEHNNSDKATVLISPSFHTGLDLKDDSSRFQIIVKVPYPDLTDRWIKAKMEKDPSWYTWRTCLTLVQAYGRSVRSKTDYADTYILDSSFTTTFMAYAKKMLPTWFMDAIIK